MSRVYDHETKQWVDIEDAEVTGKVASGRYTFEQGVRVPVMSPEGKIGTVPAEKAHEAFNKGFRWATKVDSERDFEKKNEQIIKEYYDDPTHAFLGGVARGSTLGLSDTIIPAMAEVAGGDYDSVQKALGNLREQNPKSSIAGSIAGTLVNPLTRLGGRAAYGAGKDLAAKTLTNVGGNLSKAQAATMAGIAGGAAEGAFFGVGEGLSEAALGNHEDVADQLMAVSEGTLTGLLLGGGVGAAFAGARPAAGFLSQMGKSTINSMDSVARSMAQKATKGVLVPTLSATGQKELAKLAGDLATNPKVRHAYYEGGKDAVKQVVKDVQVAQKEAAKYFSNQVKGLQSYIRRIPQAERETVDLAIKEAGGNLLEAETKLYGRIKDDYGTFQQFLTSNKEPAKVAGKLYDRIDQHIKQLQKGDEASKALSKQLTKRLEDEVGSKIYVMRGEKRASALKDLMTEGQEIKLAQELRAMAGGRVYGSTTKTPYGARRVLESMRKDLDNLALKGHPNAQYAQVQSGLDAQYEAFTKLRSFVQTNMMKKNLATGKLSKSDKKMLTRLTDPENLDTVTAILDNVAEFAGDIAKVSGQFRSLSAKRAAMEEAVKKVKYYQQLPSHEKVDLDIVEDTLKAIGVKGQPEKVVAELRQFQAELASAEPLTPISKYIRLKRALGQSVDGELEALSKLEPGFEALKRLEDSGVPESALAKNLASLARFKKGVLPVGSTGAVIGGVMGGIPGAAAGAAVDVIGAAKQNPARLLESLTQLEKVSQKGAKTINNAMQKVSDSLVSEKSRKLITISKVQAQESKERRETAEKMLVKLRPLTDPNRLTDSIQNSVAALDGAPQIQQAVIHRMVAGTAFLLDKMPRDPFEGQNVYAGGVYKPSELELHQFERYVTAVDNPAAVVDNVANGSVTVEEVEALKAVHPGIYNRLQDTILSAITEEGVDLPYGRKILLGTLFDVPTDPSLAGDFMGRLQAQFRRDKGGRPEGSGTSGPPKRALDTKPMETVATQADKIENRGLT